MTVREGDVCQLPARRVNMPRMRFVAAVVWGLTCGLGLAAEDHRPVCRWDFDGSVEETAGRFMLLIA